MPNMKQVLEGLDSVNKVLEEVPRLKTGYHGLVVDNFDCHNDLTTAVEQAVGGKLFHHIVESDLVATGILKELNTRKLPGVFTFLPLNRIRSKQRTSFDRDQTKNAFPIMDKIRYQEQLNVIMEFVFNGVLVCRDMATVVQMARSTGRDCVTLEGDKSSAKGVLAGGYLDKEKSRMAGWIKYKQSCGKVQELKDQLSRLGTQRDDLIKSEGWCTSKIEEVQRSVRLMEAEVP